MNGVESKKTLKSKKGVQVGMIADVLHGNTEWVYSKTSLNLLKLMSEALF